MGLTIIARMYSFSFIQWAPSSPKANQSKVTLNGEP